MFTPPFLGAPPVDSPAQPQAEPPIVDRRKAKRLAPCPVWSQIFLSWWEENYQSTPGVIRNLSPGGAAVDTMDLPPDTQSVRLCLISPLGADWIPARVLEITGKRGETQRVRVEFENPLPKDLFQMVVLGYHDER